ncbi:hypothetical protein PIB30_051679 [Stylosanthes scabra]|uniref:Uncharacterized protein n=1 Tax=Stylosanthes scabra TaxID=79078 RepID=A0ABU6TIE6_9FABA|nr:hypothetical protein [Stylosanthes scabra]
MEQSESSGSSDCFVKSERSDDMFCDDIPVERVGLHDNWDDAEGDYTTRSSLHPLCIYASYEVWVSHFHPHSSHANLRKSRLSNLGGFSDSHDVGGALACYGATITSKPGEILPTLVFISWDEA